MFSLRTRLILLILAALFPVFLLVIFNSNKNQQSNLERASADLLSFTQLGKLSVESAVEGTRQLLNAVTSGPSLKDGKLNALCLIFLQNIRDSYPLYANLGLLDLDGNLSCHAVDMVRSRYAGDRVYFKEALATKSFAIGDYQIGRATGKASIGFGKPVFDNEGLLRGVAFAAIDLAKLAFNSELALPPAVTLTLTDRNGTILASQPSQPGRIGSKYPDAALYTAMKALPAKTVEATDPDGVVRIYAIAAVGDAVRPALFVIASIPREAIIAPIKDQLATSLLVLTLLTVLGTVAALWFGSRVIVAPTRRLLTQMHELVDGGVADTASQQALTGSRDEIGQLSKTFGRMATILKARELERGRAESTLRKTQERLLSAQRIAKIGNWELDVATDHLWWSDQVYEIFGVSPGSFAGNYASFTALIFPADRERFQVAQENLLSGKGSLDIEHRIVTGAGEVRWVHERGERQTDESGTPVKLSGTVLDITHRKVLEANLRVSQTLLNMASRVSRLGGWQMNLSDNTVTWSDEIRAIHEVPSNYVPLFDTAVDFYAPESRDTLLKIFGACVEHGTPFDAELQIVTANGRKLWVRVIGEAVRDASGKIASVQGATQDISAQKEAESRERTMADRLAATLESINDGFMMFDHDWRFSFVNGKAETILKSRRVDLIGKVVWDVFPESAGSIFQVQYQKAFDTNQPVFFEEHSPLGLWLNVSVYPSQEGLAVYFRDVTQKRLAEVHLRLLDTAMSRLNDLVVITGAEPLSEGPRIVFVNDAFERRTGYRREESLGRSPKLLQGPNTSRVELDRIRAALEKWQPVRAELLNYTKTGEEFWLELDIVPIANDAGWFTHWVSIERDITERKQVEERTQNLNKELEQRVAQRTAELVAAREAAELANRAKSTFLATMSHEIRTPMNGMFGMLELLSLTELDAEQRTKLELVRESGKSLLHIIDDILDFSKIEAGKLDVRPEIASVNDIIDGVFNIYAGNASSKGLRLTRKVDPQISPAVLVDPLRLRQILNNFVSNALKFTAKGSIEIRAELAERTAGEDRVQFLVKDTGIGISAENQQRLFQPFSQVGGDNPSRYGGTGLGLSICRRLAEMMGGNIEMQSALGKGTTLILTLSLPIADPTGLPKSDPDSARDTLPATTRLHRVAPSVADSEAEGTLILLVEDHPTNRNLLISQVHALGYAVIGAEDGVDALEKWKSGRFGMVITDCNMPEMDGFELARCIRELEAGRGGKRIPIIACTANALGEVETMCLAAGMDDYIVKPIVLARMQEKLDQWLPLST